MGRDVGELEEVIEVFSPLTLTIPCQPCLISTIHSIVTAWLPPPEMSDGSSEFCSEIDLLGFTEVLLCLSFYISDLQICILLSKPRTISCLESNTGQKDQIELLLQLGGIPHQLCPPTGSRIGITTTT